MQLQTSKGILATCPFTLWVVVFLIACSATQACTNTVGSVALPTEPKSSINTGISPEIQSTTLNTMAITPPTILAAPSNEWEDNWLKRIPCAAPCFYSIIPSQTSGDQAKSTIQNKLPSANIEERSDFIRWIWAGTNLGNSISLSEGTNTIVTAVFVSLRKPVLLGDVIKNYGDPTSVLAYGSPIISAPPGGEPAPPPQTAVLLYLSQGFFITYNASSWSYPALDTKLPISSITFFQPTLEGLQKTRLTHPSLQPLEKVLVKWHGYDTFQSYCGIQLFCPSYSR